MIGLVIFAAISGFIFVCGWLSFLMMFQDHTPSQNSYAWPYFIPAGLVGLCCSGAAALAGWLA